jgi:hypothetical protein
MENFIPWITTCATYLSWLWILALVREKVLLRWRLLVIMALQWPEFQSIHSYKHMNHREMFDLRDSRYLAIKTDSTYTDI